MSTIKTTPDDQIPDNTYNPNPKHHTYSVSVTSLSNYSSFTLLMKADNEEELINNLNNKYSPDAYCYSYEEIEQ